MSSTPKSARKHRTGLSRIAAACERCRKRKQKCDAKRPSCGPCSAIGVECVISDRLVVYSSPDCRCDELGNKVIELETRIESLQIELEIAKEHNPLPESLSSIHPDLQSRAPNEEQPANVALGYRLLRPTFGVGDTRAGIDVDGLGLAWRLWHNDQSTETPYQNTSSIEDVPVSEYGKELVDVFFDNSWAHLPILHKPTFLRDHFEPVLLGVSTNRLSSYQVYVVFAIAAGTRPITKNGYTFAHHDFFQRAVLDLPHIMTLDDLDYLQCLLLMCMYGRNEPQFVNMWHTTGLALRTAVSLNLHHQESVSNSSLLESEMAKRLFWSAYVMDRSLAIALGRPLGIQDSDIVTSLPLQYTDEGLTTRTDLMISATPRTDDMSTFIHVIKLRRLNADIYQAFHSAGSVHLSDEQLNSSRQTLGQMMNDWLITAPRYMISTSMQQSPEWFQIAYHHAILSLNRPSHAAPIPSVASLRLCADASISLISCYGSLYAKNKVTYSFIALNSIFMAAITMLYTLRASSAVRQELSKAVTQTNINTCLSLFRGISGGREIAEKCSQIVNRLGQTTLALFDRDELPNDHLDLEFMSWFGLKTRHNGLGDNSVPPTNNGNQNQNTQSQDQWLQQGILDLAGPPTSMSIESAWQDFFAPGFDFEGSSNLDFFPMGML